eukprot:403360881
MDLYIPEIELINPQEELKQDLKINEEVDYQVPHEVVQQQPAFEVDEYYEDYRDMMFLGFFMENICSICAQLLPDVANHEGEKGMFIGNEITYCPIQNSNHRGHRKCVEDAAFKEIQSKVQTFCCDCRMPQEK